MNEWVVQYHLVSFNSFLCITLLFLASLNLWHPCFQFSHHTYRWYDRERLLQEEIESSSGPCMNQHVAPSGVTHLTAEHKDRLSNELRCDSVVVVFLLEHGAFCFCAFLFFRFLVCICGKVGQHTENFFCLLVFPCSDPMYMYGGILIYQLLFTFLFFFLFHFSILS